MAADIEGIKREFVPGLRIHVPDMPELDRLEAALGLAVVPNGNNGTGNAQKWDRREKLKDRIRQGLDSRMQVRQLGNIVVTVLANPLSRLNTAIDKGKIKRSKENGIEQAIKHERDAALVRLMSAHCVGMTVEADVMSMSGARPLGHINSDVWYAPRLPDFRTKQVKGEDRNLTPTELLDRAAPTIQIVPVNFKPYDRDEAERRAHQVEEGGDVIPSLSLNEVLARAESDLDVTLSVGSVVKLPVKPVPGDPATQWGNEHVVTGVHVDDTGALFEGAKVLHGGDPGILEQPSLLHLPVQVLGSDPWDQERIVESMKKLDRGFDGDAMHAYLGTQAALGEVTFHMEPLVA